VHVAAVTPNAGMTADQLVQQRRDELRRCPSRYPALLTRSAVVVVNTHGEHIAVEWDELNVDAQTWK